MGASQLQSLNLLSRQYVCRTQEKRCAPELILHRSSFSVNRSMHFWTQPVFEEEIPRQHVVRLLASVLSHRKHLPRDTCSRAIGDPMVYCAYHASRLPDYHFELKVMYYLRRLESSGQSLVMTAWTSHWMTFQCDWDMARQKLPVASIALKLLVQSCGGALGSIEWQDYPVMVDCYSAKHCDSPLSVSVCEQMVHARKPRSSAKDVLQRP